LERKKWVDRPINVAASDAAVSADGRHLACTRLESDHKTVGVWDLVSGLHVRDLEPHSEAVSCLAWSPDGAQLAIDSLFGKNPGGIWDAQTGKRVRSFPATTPRVSRIAWSADGVLIALGGMDGTVHGHCSPGGYLALLSWSRDGKTLWAVDTRRTRRWLVADGELLNEWKNPGYFSQPGYWAMSVDSRQIVAPCGTIRILDSETGELQGAFVPLRNEQAVAISPDGHWRGTEGADNEIVYVVETEAGQEVLSPKEFEKRYDWTNDPKRVRLSGAESKEMIRLLQQDGR
jgi:WD40 repeat protein